jgi:hypothetical protein
MRVAAFTSIASLLSVLPSSAVYAQQDVSADWQAEKCIIYEASWAEALSFFGSENVNYNFIAQNENFIAAGCKDSIAVCPQSSQELDIANALTINMMNHGTASTFLPFNCRSD